MNRSEQVSERCTIVSLEGCKGANPSNQSSILKSSFSTITKVDSQWSYSWKHLLTLFSRKYITKCLQHVLILMYILLQHFDCRNHIRVIQSMGNGERLYICGTNAHNPKDWVIYVSKHLFNHKTAKFVHSCDDMQIVKV